MALGDWQLAVCGINYKSSTLAQREPLQIGRDDIAEANSVLSNLSEIKESAIVSTCNRVEIYFVADRKHQPTDISEKFYKKFRNLDIPDFHEHFYTKKNRHAVAHLFRVAAGIDSMVLGENQILGQVRDAYSSACAVKASGKVIHRLFHQAFRVGKMVRTDTEMGKGACSVSSATVELLKSKIGGINRPAILFVGINQMIALAASNLYKADINRFTFANRTPEKAITMAAKYKTEGFSLDRLPDLLTKTDVVISCTGASHPVITRQMLDDLSTSNPDKKIIIMDMAVPRDVDAEKNYNEYFEILDLEDVQQFVKIQQSRRELAIPEAEKIIERKLDEFIYWYNHVRYEPIYNGLDGLFESIRQQELAGVLNELDPAMQSKIDSATKNLINKLLQIKLKAGIDNNSKR
jgi:glutamyl-tRNA reductase